MLGTQQASVAKAGALEGTLWSRLSLLPSLATEQC